MNRIERAWGLHARLVREAAAAQNAGEAEALRRLAIVTRAWAKAWEQAEEVDFEGVLAAMRRRVAGMVERLEAATCWPNDLAREGWLRGARRGLALLIQAFGPVPDPGAGAAETERQFFEEAAKVLGSGEGRDHGTDG